ncbi:DUF547 domain-containing protein [Acanthopleuribacter pedis]|uniref:DUF547 domain-containing protein n=1 Tax=Acanthopleuribacter pedis TaxID=442870 RepID=A0A8J7U599_9BACT|nr:DUF547 domain-containing protein [Acanthopleuribacter pedis]MBO1321512.1 DUF547 domain-containing protein [Acanthopleuribacter pedis]
MRFFALLLLLGLSGLVAGDDTTAKIAELHQGVQEVYDVIVLPNGDVDYATLHQRKDLQEKLEAFRTFMAGFDPDTLTDTNLKIALLTNTYNVYTLIGVNRAWPVKSVRKIRAMFGFFTKKEWQLNGRKVSLNNIEGEWLRPLDPRIHFTVNCASASCPRLDQQVYTADNVQQLMEAATKRFLLNENKNRFDAERKEWHLSKIFEWYRKDWGKQADVEAFILKYLPEDKRFKPTRVFYLEYDWSLNGPTEPKG